MIARESGSPSPRRPKVTERYRCSEARGEEVTIIMAVEDTILGKTELVLEHKKDSED